MYKGRPAFDGAFQQLLPCPPNVTYCIKVRLADGTLVRPCGGGVQGDADIGGLAGTPVRA